MIVNKTEIPHLEYGSSEIPNPDGKDLIFVPELLSRRGEFTIWGCTALVFIGWVILVLKEIRIPLSVPFLGIFLLIAGLAVTLGNWMDRHTILILNSNGVRYTNGIRREELTWDEINKILVFPSRWGKKVHISGTNSHFFFRTLGEVKILEEVKGRMGFSEGDKILKFILDRTSLDLLDSSDVRDYYGRL